MKQHYTEKIYLDQICSCASLSRSALYRAFAKAKGVTPYRYLENIRIGQAKKLLEQGVPPLEAALQIGFSDQSHFTNAWGRFIGLTPGGSRRCCRSIPGAYKGQTGGRNGPMLPRVCAYITCWRILRSPA